MKRYINLVKPGIIFSNLFTAFTGIFMASYGNFNFSLVVLSLLGLLLVLMSSTLLNNYLDRDIDKLMDRTQIRSAILAEVSIFKVLLVSIIFGIVGVLILFFFVNILTGLIVSLGYFFYIVVYTIYAKRNTRYSTILGSISGAVLPLAGYTAITSNIDTLAISLFLILAVWQMPHFYAIGIFRLQDYKRVNMPILPVVSSILTVKIHIIIWTVLFLIVSLLPYIFGYSGLLYFVVVFIVNFLWIIIALKGIFNINVDRWARVVFFYSIFNLLVLCIIMMIDKITYGG